MNKTTKCILFILLALAGIAVICLTANRIVFAYFSREYGRMVLYLVVDILCVELSGTAIARLIKLWKEKKS